MEAIREVVASLPRDTIVIHGAAHGADMIADHYAALYGLAVLEYPAVWLRHGRAAGPIRNALMLREGKPDLAHAFVSSGPHGLMSRGTADMVRRLDEAGVPVTIHYGEV